MTLQQILVSERGNAWHVTEEIDRIYSVTSVRQSKCERWGCGLSTDPAFIVLHAWSSWQAKHELSRHSESSCRSWFRIRYLHLGGFARTPALMEGRSAGGPSGGPDLHLGRSLPRLRALAVQAALLSPGAASGAGRCGLHRRGRSL